MDHRREPRFDADAEVTVTLLSGPEAAFPGRVANLSGRGMGLLVDRALPPGAAVEIEGNDTLLLGEVIYCREVGRSFAVGLKLEHALYQLRELARLSRELEFPEAAATEEAKILPRRKGKLPEPPAG